MFYVLLCVTCVHSSFAIILMGKRGMVALLCLSSLCLVIVVWLFLTMPRVCLQFVIVAFHDHTQLLFCTCRVELIAPLSSKPSAKKLVFV